MFFVVFSNSDMLSYSFVFVNNFFILFSSKFLVRRKLWYFIISISSCQELFYFSKHLLPLIYDSSYILSNCHSFVNNFFKKIRTTHIANDSGERGIWTLAPVTRPIPLAGAPLRPLEYFSKVHYLPYDVVRCVCDALMILPNNSLFVNYNISFFWIIYTITFYPSIRYFIYNYFVAIQNRSAHVIAQTCRKFFTTLHPDISFPILYAIPSWSP